MARFDDLQKLLLFLFEKSRVIICCRVSPFQKSQLTSLYKTQHPSDVILAVGDGVNDVPMLKMANVGVGISGAEGQQASRAADFSISKFKNLKHLILHHGSQNYPRIATLINFNFYKNIAITVIIFAYFVYSGYSNNIIIPQDSLSFHNLFYTNVPMFAVSISNSSFSRKIIFKWPHLYKRGSENRMLNYTTLFVYLFLAIENGMVVYLLNLYIFDASFIGSNGMGLPSCYVSYSLFCSILAVITAQIFFEMESLNILHLLSLMYTFPIWIILSLSLSFFPFVGENYGCTHHALREPVVWLTALFSAIFCCLPRLLLNFFRRYNRPSHLDIAIEIDDIDAEKIDLESSELTINQNITDFEMQITKKDKTKGYDDYYRNSEKNSWRDFVKSRLLEPIVKVN